MAGGKWFFVIGLALAAGFPACGGSSEGDGGNGTGGTAPNTCPPTLVNYGSGPGIICEEPTGTTCADTEQFCQCGRDGFEGRPWDCVPTQAGCPPQNPHEESCDGSVSGPCDYYYDGRLTCTCTAGAWLCETSPCGEAYPGDSTPCDLAPGDICRFFLPATASDPDNAPNVTCTCGADQTWSCPAW